MREAKILSLRKPCIYSYTTFSIFFAAISDDAWPWIYNNFIQIFYGHQWKILTFYRHEWLLADCPLLSYYEIPKKTIIYNWKHCLQEAILELINAEYYMYFYADYYYIPGSQYYKKKHYFHELFVYGYDLLHNKVYLGDNVIQGRFTQYECRFQDIEMAFWCVLEGQEYMHNIYLIRPKEEAKGVVDTQVIKNELENYLYSQKDSRYVEQQKCSYGFQAIDYIYEECVKAAENGTFMDYRPFHLLYEHAFLMELRVKYMMKEGVMTLNNPLLLNYKMLKNEYSILRNMVIKYDLELKKESIEKIIYHFGSVIRKEKELTVDLLYKIKD
jgi:hypothetical protein